MRLIVTYKETIKHCKCKHCWGRFFKMLLGTPKERLYGDEDVE